MNVRSALGRNRLLGWVAVIVLVAAGVAIAQRDDASTVSQFLSPMYPGAPTTVVQQGAGWTLEVVTPPGQEPCYQVRIGSKASYCMSTHYSEGDMVEHLFTGDGHRIALFVNAGSDHITGVWWAKSGHSGVDSIVLTDALRAIVIDFSHDEPWGLQVIDSQGSLLHTVSYVGS